MDDVFKVKLCDALEAVDGVMDESLMGGERGFE